MTGSADAADAGLLVGLAAGGAVSGLIPAVNAEALLTAATAASSNLWLALAACLTVGQCAAKVLIYEVARYGPGRLQGSGRVVRLADRLRARVDRHRPVRTAPGRLAWLRPEGLLRMLSRPVPGTSVVLLSASVGMPPLAAVSVMAGAARLRLPLFVAACVTGRLARFVVIAWPVAHLLA